MNNNRFLILLLLFFQTACLQAQTANVKVGIDVLMEPENIKQLKGKNLGVVTNHTAVNKNLTHTLETLEHHAAKNGYTIKAAFAPEHGINGSAYASESVNHQYHNIPIYSLHGSTRRPTDAMLKNINLLIFDIQDIGSRSYTYITTLFYIMEEAAKRNIPVMVLDRPNPINGYTIDGPMLEDELRSMVGYINVPYCHGMTVGELAKFYNSEYKINCKLTVIPMKGWTRDMTFQDTGLPWIPTSPQIPEAVTPLFYPITGILGEISLVNIGVGYTLPFKLVGAPWINADLLAKKLNAQNFPGIHFKPFHYKPFYGKFAHENCQGVLIVITDIKTYKPVSTQYLILGTLKNLYPEKFNEAIRNSKAKQEMFHKVNGTKEIYRIMTNDPYIIWTLRGFQEKERGDFKVARKKYLLY
jgi:uncharacterized protein YbbC (DUF1343 family)